MVPLSLKVPQILCKITFGSGGLFHLKSLVTMAHASCQLACGYQMVKSKVLASYLWTQMEILKDQTGIARYHVTTDTMQLEAHRTTHIIFLPKKLNLNLTNPLN